MEHSIAHWRSCASIGTRSGIRGGFFLRTHRAVCTCPKLPGPYQQAVYKERCAFLCHPSIRCGGQSEADSDCMVEKHHPDGLCGKSVVVTNNSSECILPGDGTCPTRSHSGCWSLLVDPLVAWKGCLLSSEVIFQPGRNGQSGLRRAA
jgi:hypothetical protein